MSRIGCALALGLTVLSLPTFVVGQVGHAPDTSPYRDLRIKQTITLFGGYLTGGRGDAGVGPSDGHLIGARWDLHVGGAATLLLGVTRSDLERNLVNPAEPPGPLRDFGTARQNVWILDGGVNLVLTGRKTWHRVAPYVGAAMGIAIGGSVPEDSVFRFDRKFHVGPVLGFRLFLNRRFHLRVEGRDILWRNTYPQVYVQPPANDPTAPPVLDPSVTTLAEWVHHPMLKIGLGWTMRL